jgi:RimJ/RimL family protein N-acetyltransferase
MDSDVPLDINIRPADMGDAQTLLAWRNDPLTRANSRNGGEVGFAEHIAWLRGVLSSNDRLLLVAEERGRPVGTCRADRRRDGWELSWTVAPEARGRGIGTWMVKAVRGRLHGRCCAEIKQTNEASLRIAAAAGLKVTVLATGHSDEMPSRWALHRSRARSPVASRSQPASSC